MPPRPVRLFYWDPRRSLHDLKHELRFHGHAWARARLGGGRLLQNFGDALSPELMAMITRRRIRWTPPHKADALGIGSLIERLEVPGPPVQVWGSGLRAPRKSPAQHDREVHYLAVRGELTRTSLGLPDETPLGDPGILAGLLYGSSAGPRRGAVIIPHFTDLLQDGTRAHLARLKSEGFVVMMPSSSPRDVWEQIVRADFVFSSGLHGLVLADAAGVPAHPVTFGARTEPWDKFDDYHSAYAFEVEALPFQSSHLTSLRDAAAARSVPLSATLPARQEALMRAVEAI